MRSSTNGECLVAVMEGRVVGGVKMFCMLPLDSLVCFDACAAAWCNVRTYRDVATIIAGMCVNRESKRPYTVRHWIIVAVCLLFPLAHM